MKECCQEMSTHQPTQSHKPAKKSKDQGKVLDRISSLPDEILSYILSCLPPKCAVATSLLSRRWRYLFRLTTKLHFDDSRSSIGHTNYSRSSIGHTNFKKFVHLFLAHHTSSIKEFGLKCYNTYDTSDLDVWISVALLKDVQKLYLDLENDFYRKEQRLPVSLFNSKSLQVLRICANIDLVVPKTVCLPNLKVLNFTGLTFDDEESFGRLCGCTLLEVLTFSECEFYARTSCFCMCSPTLKYLTFNECDFETIKIDAPSLQNATFEEFGDTFFWCTDHSLKDESAATYLSLQRNIYGLIAAYETPAYLNLASLKLGRPSVICWEDWIDVLCNSPRLGTVIFYEGLINRYKGDKDRRQLDEWFKEPKVASLSIHAEVIEVHRFSGNEIELYLLEHLLQMAKKLKSLILHKDHKMKMEHDELKMAKQLLMLPRVSDYCQIELV